MIAEYKMINFRKWNAKLFSNHKDALLAYRGKYRINFMLNILKSAA